MALNKIFGEYVMWFIYICHQGWAGGIVDMIFYFQTEIS